MPGSGHRIGGRAFCTYVCNALIFILCKVTAGGLGIIRVTLVVPDPVAPPPHSLSALPSFWDYSGKMACLCRLLQAIFKQSDGPSDKVVVISNFTQTLDYIQVGIGRLVCIYLPFMDSLGPILFARISAQKHCGLAVHVESDFP